MYSGWKIDVHFFTYPDVDEDKVMIPFFSFLRTKAATAFSASSQFCPSVCPSVCLSVMGGSVKSGAS